MKISMREIKAIKAGHKFDYNDRVWVKTGPFNGKGEVWNKLESGGKPYYQVKMDSGQYINVEENEMKRI